MNLGGASNVDLTEAARLLKQGAVGAGTGVQSQQVPPQMMLMQQAVAMQQFQFQQALLMQQVMATQQAAARAANVKSAQEMAAARAAEISKLLKGNEPELEAEKKSPGRSMSRTPSRSRSRSRSFSRSKSRSPLRYRRDRSASRSPIRYRRDSRPSPVSREYFGYRGRSRRGYYRGRGEYGWNASYRRDWERERDYHSSRSRRSRSRSRSRVRRRSHTRSRSPRSRRDRSGTPLRYRREERRSGRSSRRSRSVEVRPTPSRSSRSRSRSRSPSESLHLEHGSQSPVRKSRGTSGLGPVKGERMSPVPNEARGTLMSSLDAKGGNEKNYSDDIALHKEGALEQLISTPKGRDQQAVSPARSLSVSVSPPRRRNGGALEGEPKLNDWNKAMLRETLVQRIEEVASLVEQPHSSMAPLVVANDGGKGSPAAVLEQEIDTKGAFKSKGADFVAKARYSKKESDRMDLSSDESDGNKEVDDWRDDIKANELEKIKRMESKREMEKREEERRALPVQVVVQEEVKGHGMTLLEHLGRGTGKLSVESPFAPEVLGDKIAAFKSRKDISSNDIVPVEPKYSDETRANGNRNMLVKEEIPEEIPDRVSTGNGEGDVDMDEEAGDVTHEKSTGSADVSDREEDSDVVFEGPLPPQDLDLEVFKRSPDSSKGEDSAAEIGAEEPPLVAEEDIVENLKEKDKTKSREDEVRGLQRGKDKSRLKEDDESYENRKSKGKSRSRERSKSKRHDDDTDHERRKDKHRKHKRRHRRDEETEKEEDDDDEKRDVDSSKDKEERRHHRRKKHRGGRDHKQEKREKKRRRHKHRGKSPSESPDEESLVAEAEGEDVEQVAVRVHKKQSSSRENRRKEASKSPVHASGSGSD